MITNPIKHLLVSLLAIVCVAPIAKCSAYEIGSLLADYNNTNYHWLTLETSLSLWSQYYNKWGSNFTNFDSNKLNIDHSSFLKQSRIYWRQPYYNQDNTLASRDYVYYWLVWFESNGAWWINFKYYMDWWNPRFENFNVWSIAWFMHTFWDGHECLMNEVFFNNWSIIFKCSDSRRTFQILAWGYTLWNHVLYIDIYNDQDNLWRIWFEEWQARVVTASQSVRSDLMYWEIPINEWTISQLFASWFKQYDVSPGWSNLFPTCSLGACTPQSNYINSVWFVYSLSLTQDEPNISPSTPNNPVITTWWTAWSLYTSCFQEWTNISSLANSWHSCRSQMMSSWMNINEFRDVEDYVLNMTWLDENRDQITSNPYCQSFIVDARFLMNQYNNLPYYKKVVNEARKYNTSSNMLSVEWYCWENPLTHETNTITTREDIYWESAMANEKPDWSSDNWFTATLKNVISAPQEYIYNNLIVPYSWAFYSWYNQIDIVSCSNKPYFATPYWDEIFLVCVAFLFFIFLSVF